MLQLNGAHGGGQLLRTALTLSMSTGIPFCMTGIRAGRAKPGLMRQHLTAVLAAQSVCAARVTGGQIASTALSFEPGPICAGDYRFSIGTAGSTTLVLQTVLPALWQAKDVSTLYLEGGTHNPMAPPVDFLQQAFLPVLAKMGAMITLNTERYGFFPAGGGAISAEVRPARLQAISLLERGALEKISARALISGINSEVAEREVAERELAVVAQRLGLATDQLEHRSVRPAMGPGNILMIVLKHAEVTEVISHLGERHLSAEAVAHNACKQAQHYLDSGAAVGEHLADQLLLPMALAGAGGFTMGAPSPHFVSNAALIEQFLPISIRATALSNSATAPMWQASLSPR